MEANFGHADLANRDYVSWKQFLQSAEKWSRQQIADYELSEIKRIVLHAYQNTSGYRALYEQAGVHPESIRTLDDFGNFPYIEKEIIRDHLEEFSVPGSDRIYVTTGGSTGVPCGMYRDPVSFAKELASKAHQYHRVGWKEGQRQIVFRGLPIASEDHMEFVERFNELRCSSYYFGTEWMEVYRKAAWGYMPDWIRCYPSSGYLFARYIQDSGRPFPPLSGILCSSENLYDFQKALLEKVFNVRVFSHYGHYEMAVLAGFCEYEDTFHVLPQYGYAELIGSNGRPVTQPGQVGEIVGTSFIMHATPFVRYRTQDLAVLKRGGCLACGRPYQVWERIEGRLQELIVTRRGRYISTSMLNMHDDFYDHIKQFQFYQKEAGTVIFRHVPKDGFTERVQANMRAKLMSKLGTDIELIMQDVKDIPVTPRGKHQLLVQELKLRFDDAALQDPLRVTQM